MNNKQILVGENDDLSHFSFDNDRLACGPDKMTTPLLTIQNGTVVSSICKGFLKSNFDKPNIIIILIIGTNWINSSKNKCWSQCGRKGGKCSYCDVVGSEGFCCRRDHYSNGDCPDSAIAFSDRKHHGCVYDSRSGFVIFLRQEK